MGIMLRWHFQAMDVVGRSRGLALGINPRTIRVITSWGGLGFLGMDLFSVGLGMLSLIFSFEVIGRRKGSEVTTNQLLDLGSSPPSPERALCL